MGPARRQILLNALKLFDLVSMVGCFLAATLVALRQTQSSLTFEEVLSMRIRLVNFFLFAGLMFVWHLIFTLFGLYGSRRFAGRRADVIDFAKASTVSAVFMLLAAAVFHIRLVTHLFVVVFWVTAMITTISSRLLLRAILERFRLRGRNLRFMLIVGTNRRAIEFANRIARTPSLGYRILGFVDQDWHGLQQIEETGLPLVSDFESVPYYLRRNVVDEVVMTLPMRSLHEHGTAITSICAEQGITIRVLNNLFDLKGTPAQAEELEGATLMTHYAGMAEGWPMIVKRVLDVLLSLALLIVLAPLLALVAILIKLASPGPVFFMQHRLGLNKRRFSICKFRTMITNAEQQITEIEHLNEASGPVFKIKDDPRITPIGKFLRKTSIDELPQLLNVLRGDMSLVGPRPLPVRDWEGFDKDWQRRRFSVRPGITCLWQIMGRSSISFEKWMQLDLQYIDMWSLRLDLEILLRTIPAVLRGSGAA
ncbi:MAG: sugar transferase [Terriglobales bacterium]|jgi:exopolysaccharide biosynthesis polyprenyl glycosylphosphotransferase